MHQQLRDHLLPEKPRHARPSNPMDGRGRKRNKQRRDVYDLVGLFAGYALLFLVIFIILSPESGSAGAPAVHTKVNRSGLNDNHTSSTQVESQRPEANGSGPGVAPTMRAQHLHPEANRSDLNRTQHPEVKLRGSNSTYSSGCNGTRGEAVQSSAVQVVQVLVPLLAVLIVLVILIVKVLYDHSRSSTNSGIPGDLTWDELTSAAHAHAPNVEFYRGAISAPQIGRITELHERRGHYEWLEARHDYVQWLFPNLFQSQYNNNAWHLSMEEASIFQGDHEIAKRYVCSYELFLDFLGLELCNRTTGAIDRSPGGEQRLREALIRNPHNLLRIRRILASLAVTGFRRYMKPLVEHLTWEVIGRVKGQRKPALSELGYGPEPPYLIWREYIDGNPDNFFTCVKAREHDCKESVFFARAGGAQSWIPTRPGGALTAAASRGLVKNASLDGVFDAAECKVWAEHKGGTKVCLWQGDITQLKIDAIVNPANANLQEGGGACGAIFAAAGSQLAFACARIGRCSTGCTVITDGFDLPAHYVLHTVGPQTFNVSQLRSCYDTVLKVAAQRGIQSIGLCAVATGIYGFPLDDATEIALETVRSWLDAHPGKMRQLVFVTFGAEAQHVYEKHMLRYFPTDSCDAQIAHAVQRQWTSPEFGEGSRACMSNCILS